MTTATGDAALLRSSAAMAIGTIVSRVTGLVRTILVATVIGTTLAGDAFNVANTVPNIVYELLLGGVLTSVLVPLLVRAGHEDTAAGAAYAQRLLSAVILVLGAATLLMVAAAPWLMKTYMSAKTPGQLRMATTLARYFLPQIFFYGVGATLGAILNTRGSFGAPMWAPVLNNVVGIGTLLMLLSTHPDKDRLTPGQLTLLGVGVTLGIVVQTLALVPSLRAVGFRLRLTTRLRGSGLGRALRLGAWTLVYVAANQVAYFVVVKIATHLTPSYSVYVYAYLVFSLPHAIVAVSVISALLPQMSRHAANGDRAEVARALARGTRLAAVVLLPSALLLIALHAPIAHLLFGYRSSASDAVAIGNALAFFALGLVPFSAFQLQLRAFYSLADTRTPALINLGVNAVNIAADLVLVAVLPPHQRLYGLAAGYALSYAAGWIVTTRVLTARLGRLGTPRTVRLLIRLLVAGGLGAAIAAGIAAATARLLGTAAAGSAAAVVVGGAAAVAIAVVAARRLRVAEVEDLVAVVLRRRSPLSRPGPDRRSG